MYFQYNQLCYLGLIFRLESLPAMEFINLHVIAALIYSGLILLSALSANKILRYGIPLLAILLSVAIDADVVFVMQAVGYIGVTFLLKTQKALPDWLKYFLWAVWGVLSVGLLTHTLPGYSGIQLTILEPVKANSLATNVYLNTDKVLIAWSLLLWIPIWQRNATFTHSHSPKWLPFLLAISGIPAILFLATQLGLIQWQPELNNLIAIIVISNLLNTCFAEELLFRGAMQSWLSTKLGVVSGLLITGTLFGLAHFAGGFLYVCLAIMAGLLYGLIYVLSGRLIWSVICHWMLNSAHVLLLTWPVVKPG